MLNKQFLEQLINAWPNEEGHSSNPALYENWIERERRYNGRVIQNALGVERINSLSEKQRLLLEKAYAKLLSKKDITEISDNEILGQYELITEHLFPIGVEMAAAAHKAKDELRIKRAHTILIS